MSYWTPTPIVRAAAVTIIVAGVCAGITQAGDLNPPSGPIQATDRVTLNEQSITLPYTITQSGSYVLTSNLTGVSGSGGIIIAVSNVTLDLNGFTLQGVAGSLDGIGPDGSFHRDVVIKNGIVKDWGGSGITSFNFGLPFSSEWLYTRIENITVSSNGGSGIFGGLGAIIKRCNAHDNGLDGITQGNLAGLIIDCVANNNGGNGFGIADTTTVINCSAANNQHHGLEGGTSGATIIACTFSDNEIGGMRLCQSTTVRDCTIHSNSGYGILVFGTGNIVGNSITHNSGDGIMGGNIAPEGNNRIEGNNIALNGGFGINLVNNQVNFVYRNTFSGNIAGTFNIHANNSAPLTNNAATAGPFHNIEQ